MELEIKPDPRFKRQFSLNFGLVELTPEELEAKQVILIRNVGLFLALTSIAATIGFLTSD
jgi:hypothetical protein